MVASSTKQVSQEERLFELVRMVREWVERSFTPQQEERFKEKGLLRARFQVDLGQEMVTQLQAYVGASFVLKLLKLRVVKREAPGKRAQESVEVVMNAEARALYAEKCPDAVAKYRQQLVPAEAGGEGLVDADDEGPAPLPLEGRQAALQDKPADAAVLVGTPGQDGKKRSTAGVDATASAAKCSRRSRPSTRVGEALASAPKEVASAPKAPPDAAAGKDAAAKAPSAAKGAGAGSSGGKASGSVWEQCAAQDVAPGTGGLMEARDAIDKSLAASGGSGLGALRAEKDVAAWLKGLASRTVTPADLRETRIGISVNACRKHPEPFISGLAVTLLSAWKRSWREAQSAGSTDAA